GDKRVGDGDNLVARAHARGQQGQLQRVGAAGAGNRVGGSAVRREVTLERIDKVAANELRLIDNVFENGGNILAHLFLLGAQIDKGYVHESSPVRVCSVWIQRAWR